MDRAYLFDQNTAQTVSYKDDGTELIRVLPPQDPNPVNQVLGTISDTNVGSCEERRRVVAKGTDTATDVGVREQVWKSIAGPNGII